MGHTIFVFCAFLENRFSGHSTFVLSAIYNKYRNVPFAVPPWCFTVARCSGRTLRRRSGVWRWMAVKLGQAACRCPVCRSSSSVARYRSRHPTSYRKWRRPAPTAVPSSCQSVCQSNLLPRDSPIPFTCLAPTSLWRHRRLWRHRDGAVTNVCDVTDVSDVRDVCDVSVWANCCVPRASLARCVLNIGHSSTYTSCIP